MIDIRIQTAPFDPAAEQDDLRRGRPEAGALVAFTGLMRDTNADHHIHAMTLEHYPGMTERALTQIAEEASRRWRTDAIRIVHRVGRLLPEEPIVLVAVLSRHRGEAFRACELLIDYLKTKAPFWKKEETDQGERWVAARDSDQRAAARWDEPSG
ncbi:MAG: molybdenum cofactor biosynthesis protein MoaE [Thiohalocapsa sp.]